MRTANGQITGGSRNFKKGLSRGALARQKRRATLLGIAAASALTHSARSAWATTYTWTGAHNANWAYTSSPYNWSPTGSNPHTTSDIALFNDTGALRVVQLGGNYTVNAIDFAGTRAWQIQLSNSGATADQILTFGGTNPSINVASGDNANIEIGDGWGNISLGGSLTVYELGNGTLTIDRPITASANGVSLSGNSTGTLVLSGGNTYTGTTTVAGGTLKNGSASTFSNNGALSMSGNGTFDLAGFNGNFTSLSSSASTDTITNSGGSNTTLALSNQGNTTIAAKLTDGSSNKLAVSLVNNNSGTSGLLSNTANTFSGGLTLVYNATNGANGTRLRISSLISGTPYGTGAITIGQANTDKAQILLDTVGNNTLANAIVFNTALGTDVAGGVRIDTSGNTLSGNITANLANAKFNVAGSVTLSGQITGNFGLEQDVSTGTLTLDNTGTANNYAGDTTIGTASINSILALGASNQIPNGSGAGNVILNGTLKLNGFSNQINGLSGGSTGILDGGNGTPTFTIGANNATGLTFGGVITNTAGNLALVKIGSGIQTLSGNNLYTGSTTISAGTLNVTGSLASGSAVSVMAGGTLTGSGTVGGTVAVAGNGTVDLSSTIETLTTGNLAVGDFSGPLAQLNFAANGSTASEINLGNNSMSVSGNGADINITNLSGLIQGGKVYTLVNNTNSSLGLTPGSSNNISTGSASAVDGLTLNLVQPLGFGISGNLTITTGAVELVTSTSTPAGPIYWAGTNDSVWNSNNGSVSNVFTTDGNGTIFATGLPGASNDVYFAATNAGNLTNTLGQSFEIQGLTFLANDAGTGLTPVGTVSIGGNYTLQVDADGITDNNANGVTLQMATLTAGASGNWTNNSTAPLTISAAVNGTATGGNTTTILLSNTSTGNTTLSGGISNGSGGGNLAVVISNTGSGVTIFSGNNTFSGGVALSAGTVQVGVNAVTTVSSITSSATGTGLVTINGGTIDLAGYNLAAGGLSGNGTIGSSSTAGNGKLTIVNSGNNVYSGTIQDQIAGGNHTVSVVMAGSGSETFSGNNTYSGGTTISAGTLVAANVSALGAAGTTVSFSGSSALDLATTTSVNAWALSVNSSASATIESAGDSSLTQTLGAAVVGASTINFTNDSSATGTPTIQLASLGLTSGANNTTSVLNPTGNVAVSITGLVSVSANPGSKTLDLDGNNAAANAISGNISNGTGSTLSLVKSNTSTWNLSGVNTFSGGTTISAGTLQISGAGLLGAGSYSAAISNNGTLEYSSSGNQTFTGAISGNGALIKDTSASSVLTLSGNNTYKGNTTVSTGTLMLSGTGYLYGAGQPGNATTITVASGAQITVSDGNTNNVLGFGTNQTWAVNGTINNTGNGSAVATLTLPATVTLGNGTLTGLASTGSNAQYGTFFNSGNATITATGGNNTISAANIGDAPSRVLTLNTPNSVDFLSISSAIGVNVSTPELAGGLTKTGNGTVTLSGNSIYSGQTTISAGTLIVGINSVGNNTAITSGATGAGLVTLNGGTLDLNSFNLMVKGLSGTGGTIASSSTGAPGILTIVNSGNNSYSGTIQDAIGGGNQTVSVVMAGSGSETFSGNNTYSGSTIISSGTLILTGTQNVGTGNVTVNGGSLQLGNIVSNGNNALTSSNTVILNGTSLLLAGITNTAVSYNGAFTIDMNGNASILFSGTNDNLQTGNLSSPIVLSNSGSQVAKIGETTTSNTLNLTGNISGNGSLAIAPGGIAENPFLVTISQAESYTGNTSITQTAGTDKVELRLLAGGSLPSTTVLTLTSGSSTGNISLFNLNGQDQSLAGLVSAGNANNQVSGGGNLTLTNAANYTFGGVISGGTALILNASSGSIVEQLTGNNTYTGGTTVSAGTLQIGNGTAGSNNGTSGYAVASGASLAFNQAGGTSVTPASTDNGTVIAMQSGNTTFNNVISGNGSFVQSGAGTTIFPNGVQETYTGGTIVSNGTLTLAGTHDQGGEPSGSGQINGTLTINTGGTVNAGTAWALGYGGDYVSNIVISGGTLQFGTNIAGGGTAAGNITMQGGTISATGGTGFDLYNQSGAYNPTITVNSGSGASTISANMNLRLGSNSNYVTFNVAGTTDTPELVFSGNIGNSGGSDGYGSVVKTGNGEMDLNGVNSYSGTTSVQGGTLRTTNLSGPLVVGTGSAGSGTIAVGPNATTAGTLAAANGVTFNNGGSYLWKISGVGTGNVTAGTGASGTLGSPAGTGAEGTDWDLLNLTTGSLDLSNLTSSQPFTIAPSGSITGDQQSYSWVIAQTNGTNSITLPGGYTTNQDLTSASAGGGQGALFVLNTFGLTDNSNTNNVGPSEFSLEAVVLGGHEDLVLDYTGSPEPGTTILVLGGAVPMLMGRRRRRALKFGRILQA